MEKVSKKINGKSRNRNLNPVIIFLFSILVIYTLTLFFILGWGLMTSFKSAAEFSLRPADAGGPNVLGLPDFKWQEWYHNVENTIKESKGEITQAWSPFLNYKNVLTRFELTVDSSITAYYSNIWGYVEGQESYTAGFGHFILNSFVFSIVGPLVCVFTTMTISFLCQKYRYKFSSIVYTVLLILMTVTLIGTGPATIEVTRSLGIYSTYGAIIIMNLHFNGLYFFVFYAHFQGVSDGFLEAAEIDGSSQLMSYLRIVVPLSAKIFGTIFLMVFIANWNNYDLSLVYYPSKPTIAYAIYMLENNPNKGNGVDRYDAFGLPQKVAGMMILAIPVLILFLAFKDMIMGNLSMGGLKE